MPWVQQHSTQSAAPAMAALLDRDRWQCCVLADPETSTGWKQFHQDMNPGSAWGRGGVTLGIWSSVLLRTLGETVWDMPQTAPRVRKLLLVSRVSSWCGNSLTLPNSRLQPENVLSLREMWSPRSVRNSLEATSGVRWGDLEGAPTWCQQHLLYPKMTKGRAQSSKRDCIVFTPLSWLREADQH